MKDRLSPRIPFPWKEQWSQERPEHAGWRKLLEVARYIRRHALHPALRNYRLTHAIRCEIRSTVERIRVLLAKSLDRSGVPVVGETPTTLHPLSDKYTNTCTALRGFKRPTLPGIEDGDIGVAAARASVPPPLRSTTRAGAPLSPTKKGPISGPSLSKERVAMLTISHGSFCRLGRACLGYEPVCLRASLLYPAGRYRT